MNRDKKLQPMGCSFLRPFNKMRCTDARRKCIPCKEEKWTAERNRPKGLTVSAEDRP
ncbi:hypothetical protein HMPREF3293_00976 [Christensenella minuta]|uniref:Uncharacterized protein n=1 Tax=Christensenella minuta TaxID=626937 RepID=A0A136Q6J0_9FIRM|nr:hypothetical protein HMPREF3293_00976 [Christensenella minuta]